MTESLQGKLHHLPRWDLYELDLADDVKPFEVAEVHIRKDLEGKHYEFKQCFYVVGVARDEISKEDLLLYNERMPINGVLDIVASENIESIVDYNPVKRFGNVD